MATFISSSDKLEVRFLSPAPIFIILVLMFLLCGSAGAVQVSEGTVYSFNNFAYSYNTGNSVNSSYSNYNPADTPFSGTGQYKNVLLPSSGTFPGGLTTSYIPNGYFDPPQPYARFLRLGFNVPRSSALVGLTAQVSVRCYISAFTGSFGYPITLSSNYDTTGYHASYTVSSNNTEIGTVYATSVDVQQNFVSFNYYIAVGSNHFLTGFQTIISRSYFNISNNTTSWDFPFDNFSFEISSTKILPPNSGGSGGSGGSVDLSGITSQITSLSSQMSSGFLGVNNNIDAMETSIASSIADQTVDLTDAIDQAVQDSNDHFDDWDESLENAISSSQRQQLVETDQAVSEMHQIESDQLDDTDDALSDVGLDSYSIPQDYISGFTEFGNILTVLFGALPFISPLIIFSCSLGLASVLVGRRSRSSGSGGDG